MSSSPACPIIFIGEGSLEQGGLSAPALAWAKANNFTGQRGRLLPLPGSDGALEAYLFGTGPEAGRSRLVAGLAGAALGEGTFALQGDHGDPTLAAIGFRLGAYTFDRYRKARPTPTLVLPAGADGDEVERLVTGATIARDLVNMPASHLGPDAFEAFIRDFAAARSMTFRSTIGDALLAENLPMIHAVGRAAAEEPRLVDLTWGRPDDPKITIVGKGVTFDTGGLDIKPPASMLTMKKDMGGAANVLGLVHAVVSAGLRIRLRVLIPIVENAISASAFRPGDVLHSRKGLTVEIGNTDAEGRLILADALALADEEKPDLILDMATLTGAARTALGPELPPLYSTHDGWTQALLAAGTEVEDPLWPMPLWTPYESMLASKIADTNNAGGAGFAGSVIAALFLRRFVTAPWVHLDIFAWAPEARPGRPVGGTDQAMRAVYAVLKERYPTK